MITFLIALLFSNFSLAEEVPNKKWDWEIRLVSQKFAKEYYPKGPVDAWWAAPEMNQKKGLLADGGPKQYAHMHAMVVAAFYSQRLDHQKLAMEWLKEYECENFIACRDFRYFYEGALKVSAPKKKPEAKKILASAMKREKQFEKSKPKHGLCAPEAGRSGWLELEYQIACSWDAPPSGHGVLNNKEEIEAFTTKLGYDSGQTILSSSYLDRFVVKSEDGSCAKSWSPILVCGGMQTITYSMQCERSGGTYPGKVSCKQLAVEHQK